MYRVVFIRHGQSIWNKEKIFTGWSDVDLTPAGIKEARKAASILKKEGLYFDIAFTSYLKKAIRTLWTILERMDLMWIPVRKSWRLNERHYGALQGLSKPETARKYGKNKVMMWRRSYDVRPPALDVKDSRYPGNDIKYRNVDKSLLPVTESLRDVQERLIPYWAGDIISEVKKGKKVLVAAHGNSLRALVKYLDNISDEDVINLNIPTGIPFAYEFDSDLNVAGHYYYGDPEGAEKKIKSVAGELD